MWLYFVELVLLVLLAVGVVCYYSEKNIKVYAQLLVFISLATSFVCFMLLPIDIYESVAQDQTSLNTVKTIWVIIYYVNFFLCWLILPFAQEFEDSGEFTFKNKIKGATLMNLLLIAVLCGGAVLLVLYLVLASSFSISQIPNVFATLVNVFGLTLVSILLGYGLMSFPKECFLRRDYKKKVSQCHRIAETIKTDEQRILTEVHNIKLVLQRDQTRDPAQRKTIYAEIEQHFAKNSLGRVFEEDITELSKSSNAKLHKSVKKRILEWNANENQLDQLVDDLKSITESYLKNNYSHKRVYYTILFVLTNVLSFVIFFGQLATFLRFLTPINVLPLIGWNPQSSYVWNCFLTIYVAYIVTQTIFRIKVYKMFALHKRNSAASSLMFTSINLARVCYPLCYNYLQIMNMPQASFLDFFGEISFKPEYAIVFPILMLVSGLFNLFDVYSTVLGYLGLGSYAFDEEQAEEKKEQGRNILIQRFNERNIQNHHMQMIQLL